MWYEACDMSIPAEGKRQLKHQGATPGEDGGIGRYALPPHTTKRRTTTNLKTNNQNCPKIKLYGSPLTEELKKTTKMNKQKQTKQTGTGTESHKWRSHGGLSAGRGQNVGKSSGNKRHKWQAQNRQGDVKNSVGNGEAKELIYMIHGHELRWGNADGRGLQGGGE